MNTNILVFGGGDHAKQVISILADAPNITILGIIDLNIQLLSQYPSIPMLGEDSILPQLALPTQTKCLIAIGDSYRRKAVFNKIKNLRPELEFYTLIQDGVQIHSTAQIDPGCVILSGAIIQNNCHIGAHTLIGSGSILEHDSTIGSFCTLGPGVVGGGNLRLGESSVIGLGTNIIHSIQIGSDVVVGAGSLVLKNIPDSVTAYGHPIHTLKERKPGDAWL